MFGKSPGNSVRAAQDVCKQGGDMSENVRVGLIGAGFVSDIHAHAFTCHVRNAEVVAVASRTMEKAQRFAADHGIPHAYDDYRALLARPDIDLVTVAIPNDL